MIVPDYWAEARQQHRQKGKQVTVRRFGWSTVSQAEAQSMAEARAAEALSRILAGEKLARHEPKTAYNGAFGVPIREEVLSRHGEEVITRNAYGAHCLNTPRALFADVDFEPIDNPRVRNTIRLILAVAAGLSGWFFHSWALAIILLFIALNLARPIAAVLLRAKEAKQARPADLARQRIQSFLAYHPEWSVRLYTTPGGLRLLATHRPFEPSDPEVAEFFAAVGADPVYVQMCANQQCFRARLTAKPWRIGISSHMRPNPGVWPVAPERLPLRQQWVEKYEQKAAGFAACQFVEVLGAGAVHKDLRNVIDLHDRTARALEREISIA